MLLGLRVLWSVVSHGRGLIFFALNISTGNTTDYCGTGCQAAYGTCSGSEVIAADPNMCGFENDNHSCSSGLCCSAAG